MRQTSKRNKKKHSKGDKALSFLVLKYYYCRQDEMKNSILSQILEQDARARRKIDLYVLKVINQLTDSQ